jgi:Rod binding domain-containing protein
MQVFANHPKIDPSKLQLESLAHNQSVSDADKVDEVSRQFEAVLLRQILQDIRKPVLAPTEGDATSAGIYSDMINNQLADSISRSGGFGLAKSLSGQLAHQVLARAPAPAQEKTASVPTTSIHKPIRK